MTIDKQKIPLILALAIPVLMIFIVAAFIYIPGIGKKPKINFLYLTGDEYNDNFRYFVSGEKLVKQAKPEDVYQNKMTLMEQKFYFYDVVKNEAEEISFEKASSYNLDTSAKSSDGYEFTFGSSSGGGLFFSVSGDYSNYYLRGYNRSFKLNLKKTSNPFGNYYYNVRFLGWVK